MFRLVSYSISNSDRAIIRVRFIKGFGLYQVSKNLLTRNKTRWLFPAPQVTGVQEIETSQFFDQPIINTPYSYPSRHWELDDEGQPTNRMVETRRYSELITPVPKPRKRRRAKDQVEMVFNRNDGLSSDAQEYNPTGSTRHVSFTTSKETRWQTDPRRCQINWVICDSDWEAEFCRVDESHPRVRAYVKNQNLGLEAPYLMGGKPRKYVPDFIVQIDDGEPDPLNLIVEIKGFRGEDAKEKANTMQSYWVPGVNNLGKFGCWAFAELTEVFEIESEFSDLIERKIAERKKTPNGRNC